jgi:hypothetical protein
VKPQQHSDEIMSNHKGRMSDKLQQSNLVQGSMRTYVFGTGINMNEHALSCSLYHGFKMSDRGMVSP